MRTMERLSLILVVAALPVAGGRRVEAAELGPGGAPAALGVVAAGQVRGGGPDPGHAAEEPAEPEATRDERGDNGDATLAEITRRVNGLEQGSKLFRPGFNRVVIAGDGDITFTSQEGGKGTFGAGLAPLLLWQLSDRWLIEGGLDIGVSDDGDTSVDLSIAELSCLVNDYLAVGAGLFVVPFGVYHNHFDPSWINQLPDDPLPFGDGGIAPEAAIGVFAAGAVPMARTVLDYDAYVSNGPRLVTDDPEAAGSLDFGNYDDNNSAKTIGGRVGFRPVTEMEIGYSIQYGKVGVGDYSGVNALLQAVDVEYRRDVSGLRGRLYLRAELVWSNVGNATYGDEASPAFGPLSFDNDRSGGYAQVAYRPWMAGAPWVRRLQFVGMVDWLHVPLAAPGGDRERRFVVGANYWFQPNIVLKGAYEFDHKQLGQDADAFLVQLGFGL